MEESEVIDKIIFLCDNRESKMNNRQLLINRIVNIDGNWYAPLDHIKKYKSVEISDHWNTTSSSGDWEGFFVQKIGDTRYLIMFSQTNNYPHSGFTLYTGDVIASWQGKFELKIIHKIISDHEKWVHYYNSRNK